MIIISCYVYKSVPESVSKYPLPFEGKKTSQLHGFIFQFNCVNYW